MKNNLKLYYANDWWTLMENGQKRSSFTWIWTCATWGKQKRDEFLTKALPLSHGGFYWKIYRIICHTWKGSKINYIYLQFTEILWKNGKRSFSLNSFSQSENCLWCGLICIKRRIKSGSKESKLFKKLTFMLWQVCNVKCLVQIGFKGVLKKHCFFLNPKSTDRR